MRQNLEASQREQQGYNGKNDKLINQLFISKLYLKRKISFSVWEQDSEAVQQSLYRKSPADIKNSQGFGE